MSQWRNDVNSWLESFSRFCVRKKASREGEGGDKGVGKGGSIMEGGGGGGGGEIVPGEGVADGCAKNKRKRMWMAHDYDEEMVAKAKAQHPNRMRELESHNRAPLERPRGEGVGSFVICPLCDAKIAVQDIRNPDEDVDTHIVKEHY
jgi:hypothetical protein